jgi:hypothetical protein
MPRILASLLFAGASTCYALSSYEAMGNSSTPVVLAFLLILLYAATFLAIVVGAIRVSSATSWDFGSLVRSSMDSAPLWTKVFAFGGFALSWALVYMAADGGVSISDWNAASATERALIYLSLGSFWGFPLPWIFGYSRTDA